MTAPEIIHQLVKQFDEQEIGKHSIKSPDRLTDRLVYELYMLSEEEFGIVES